MLFPPLFRVSRLNIYGYSPSKTEKQSKISLAITSGRFDQWLPSVTRWLIRYVQAWKNVGRSWKTWIFSSQIKIQSCTKIWYMLSSSCKVECFRRFDRCQYTTDGKKELAFNTKHFVALLDDATGMEHISRNPMWVYKPLQGLMHISKTKNSEEPHMRMWWNW